MKTAPIKQTGEWLLHNGLLSHAQLDLCLRAQSTLANAGTGSHKKIGEIILEYGFASRADVETAISSTGRSADGIGGITFPTEVLKRLKVYPSSLHQGVLRVAVAGTLTEPARQELLDVAIEAGLHVESIETVPTNRLEVLNKINSLSSPDQNIVAGELSNLVAKIDDSAFITQVIQHIFADALQSRASDIHFWVSAKIEQCWIAHRIDGALKFVYMVAPQALSVIGTRIKSDAGIDFSDVMRPHDGRTSTLYNGKQVEIRVSTSPADFGEKIVLRLLDSSATPSLNVLFVQHRLVRENLNQIVSAEGKGGGIILVTGATGSGKSTTLNAVLTKIDRSRRTVVAIEDPIELKIPLVTHIQVNEVAKLTYASILRATMRQDPDVIMVGELRDSETVETALRAAETGHQVYSTLHTDNVAESVTRLMGMMEPGFRSIGKYILAGSLKAIINLKLVRRLCVACNDAGTPDDEAIALLSQSLGEGALPEKFHVSVGCSRCNGTGYHGRVIVPEAMFLGHDHKTREDLELILINDRPFREAFSLPGVVWYSRRAAVSTLLHAGVLDAITALSLLDIRHKENRRT